MQIGLSGHPRTLDRLQPLYDYGYNIVTMKEFRQRGIADVVVQIKEVMTGRPVYITFDLDCLDPTIAPGVSNIEPGEKGFDIDEAVGLLHAARGLNIIYAPFAAAMTYGGLGPTVEQYRAASAAAGPAARVGS